MSSTSYSARHNRVEQLLYWLRIATNVSFALALAAVLLMMFSALSFLGSLPAIALSRLITGILIAAGATVAYLWSMATIEAIALLVDIEANTRRNTHSAP
ncbi:hypothetical protein [Lacipirellula parvula]|uniref:Uncharacterized protein n=1 Tax=Lacipirellula parvula TaxID=2650471 RepID=A0A5K7X5W8_9BACT|nr:hypothetical protein [Lacipirellula parvula]BBO31960.1 hypothetical protein PLANPX_1572 [Lacipirellula parvula]